LERARLVGIPIAHLSDVTHPEPDGLDRAILAELTARDVQVVVLAGYPLPRVRHLWTDSEGVGGILTGGAVIYVAREHVEP
jgi:hypothetical protein